MRGTATDWELKRCVWAKGIHYARQYQAPTDRQFPKNLSFTTGKESHFAHCNSCNIHMQKSARYLTARWFFCLLIVCILYLGPVCPSFSQFLSHPFPWDALSLKGHPSGSPSPSLPATLPGSVESPRAPTKLCQSNGAFSGGSIQRRKSYLGCSRNQNKLRHFQMQRERKTVELCLCCSTVCSCIVSSTANCRDITKTR